ncbi:MAG TPA: 5-(carboxyamino)imidazole ribonucleotide mutase [Spirochaetota bacterium]|nr:5-(carboxyamino)imidazole ribonucleotide mutase [Spirochaetota bacterium]HPJ34505.1 5-(carboxyamino)imidazole ribonucleotide mutase [Spirochaetota bacterium]
MPVIGIILGSDSDLPKVKECFEILEEFGMEYEVLVSSAHRSPEMTVQWVKGAREKGMKAIIAIAGGAAHLPGVVASHTTLPVIGIPIETKIAGGLDSILSILQMPSGVPVAAMPAGKAGGANAALFALSIISVNDNTVAEKLSSYRKKIEKKIEDKNKAIKEEGLMNYIKKLEGK